MPLQTPIEIYDTATPAAFCDHTGKFTFILLALGVSKTRLTILPTAWHPQARTSSCCWPLLRPEVLWLTRSNHWNKHALATVRRLLKLSPSRPKLRVRKMFPPSDDGCYIIILLSPYQIDDDDDDNDMGKYLSLSLALVCLSFARCAFRSESSEYTHPPIDMIDPVTHNRTLFLSRLLWWVGI